jgi:hypothetical protein
MMGMREMGMKQAWTCERIEPARSVRVHMCLTSAGGGGAGCEASGRWHVN